MEVKLPQNIDKIVSDMLTQTFDQSAKSFQDIVLGEANAILQNMSSRVHVDQGTLKASLGIYKSKKNPLFNWVGPEYSNRYSIATGGNHAHLVEFGSKERYMKKGLLAGGFTRKSGGAEKFKGKSEHVPYAGKSTGVMPTTGAFIRPTYDSMGASTLASLKNKVLIEVEKNGTKQGL